MGCEMLVAIYTHFSPLIPLLERVEITGKTIEVFEEIFFSIGEQDKGFSLSLSKDYATIGRINDIRTQTFGGRGLLEEEYPNDTQERTSASADPRERHPAAGRPAHRRE